MYFFFHLITGIVLGLLLGDLLHHGRWLVPCAIGAILSDLIDKPVGEILLPGIVGYGRSLFHSLPVLTVILLAGILLLKYRNSLVLLAAGIGILSHQILDLMWREPVAWLDPLLGPPIMIHRTIHSDYFLLLLQQNFENPLEWLLGVLFLIGLGLYLKRDRVVAAAVAHRKGVRLILGGLGVLLWMISGIVLALGFLRGFLGPPARFGLDAMIIVSGIIALTAFLFWRWRSFLGREGTSRKGMGTALEPAG